MRTVVELIEHKRDGCAHTPGEISALVSGFVAGRVPDYQMSAWLMAVCIRGLDERETLELTQAMAYSGIVLDLSMLPAPAVDKHSTGGVGDTTTLIVAPLVASCGVPVAKMSGRGLGFTGGTLDKLESIPGFDVHLTPEQFMSQVESIGIAVIAQTSEMVPADKKMYALRDVTGTVESIPLIVASIMSKKITGGAHGIVLDVKTGLGAFAQDTQAARLLASELVRVGASLGRRVRTVITDMSQPLGCAVGNALEVREAITVLQNKRAPQDLLAVCFALGTQMLLLGGAAHDEADAAAQLAEHLADGSALDVFRQWVAAQGGDPHVVDDVSRLPRAAQKRVVRSPRGGFVQMLDARAIGRTAMALGAGRTRPAESIDPAAGIELFVRVGDRVTTGQPIAALCARDSAQCESAAERFLEALALSADPVTRIEPVIGAMA